MLDNVTEEQESWLSLSDVSVIFLVVYIVMKGVIFGGNLLTVVTICVDSALHTPAYIFTALLAAADLLVGKSLDMQSCCKCLQLSYSLFLSSLSQQTCSRCFR